MFGGGTVKRTNNAKRCKLCAFCEYWYDPGNKAIKAVNIGMGRWDYDENASSQCTQAPGVKMRKSWQSCTFWKCKI